MKRLLVVAAVVAACGKGPSPGTPDGPGSGSGTDASNPDASDVGWTTLISRSWMIPAGTGENVYKCRRVQVPTDMYITAFRALSPVGTHHEVLTIDANDTMTGDYDCGVQSGTLSGEMLYAAGVNTDDIAFPTGVAIHLAAGTWINLNLHLFNATDNPLTGESGLLVKTVDQSQVVNLADISFSGTVQISIPSDGLVHTEGGGCAAPTDLHLFALWPHMHQIGTHQTVVLTHAGNYSTLLDTDYMFTEQKNYPIPEVLVHQGDRIQTTCSYVNNTGATVSFCDTSQCEMCFTSLYKYPAGTTGGLLGCVDK